jgi:hypothetical protein
MGAKWVPRLLLSLFLLMPATAWSVEFHGTSSSQVLWFNDFYNGRQVELAQYLRFALTNIDTAGKFSIYGYGRGTADLNNGDGVNGRLYYLYGEYRNLFDKLDIRLGRQFVNVSAGTTIVDGAQLTLKNAGPVGFTVFGGRNVAFGLNGEIGHGGDYALGMAAYLAGIRNTDLEVSWFRKWDQGDVARDIIGASFKQYLFKNIKLYSDVRYDLTAEVFNEVLAGVKYFPTANLVLTGEWYQSYPTFDTTSIYSVFAVNRYQEGVIRADYTINDIVAVNFGYNRQEYGDDGSANLYEIGCRLRPLATLSIELSYDRRQGYPGDMDGGIIDVQYDATQKLRLAGGIAYDVYQRDIITGDESAQRYWLGGSYKFSRNIRASLQIEDNINNTYNNDMQGRFILDYNF